MNYEEGSEPSMQDGEGFTELGLTEAHGLNQGVKGRDLAGEGMFEYGSRVGFWRLMRLFQERKLPMTVFGCALALERHPAGRRRPSATSGFDVCCHGWRWIKHFELTEAEEREHIRKAVASLQATVGERPLGWYCRYGPSVNTRRLVVEEGGFLYDSDYYGDELPFWKTVNGKPHLIVPYSLTNNDGKYAGWVGTSDQWFSFIRDAFDMLYKEGAKHAEDDVGRPAHAPDRPSRARRRAGAPARLHDAAQGRLDHAAGRHRPPLDRHASLSGQGPQRVVRLPQIAKQQVTAWQICEDLCALCDPFHTPARCFVQPYRALWHPMDRGTEVNYPRVYFRTGDSDLAASEGIPADATLTTEDLVMRSLFGVDRTSVTWRELHALAAAPDRTAQERLLMAKWLDETGRAIRAAREKKFGAPQVVLMGRGGRRFRLLPYQAWNRDDGSFCCEFLVLDEVGGPALGVSTQLLALVTSIRLALRLRYEFLRQFSGDVATLSRAERQRWINDIPRILHNLTIESEARGNLMLDDLVSAGFDDYEAVRLRRLIGHWQTARQHLYRSLGLAPDGTVISDQGLIGAHVSRFKTSYEALKLINQELLSRCCAQVACLMQQPEDELLDNANVIERMVASLVGADLRMDHPNCALGVEREICCSSSVMSAGMSANSGVLR